MRIEVIGNIATGKTTLAKLFCDDYLVLNEDFQSNPFWKAFYEEPSICSFETELTFTLQHYHHIKIAQRNCQEAICDFSLQLDKAYADVTLNGERKDLYLSVLDSLVGEVNGPNLLVHLKCREDILLERIRSRGRSSEASISIEYLQSLSESIEREISANTENLRILTIDSEAINFANYAEEIKAVKHLIFREIEQLTTN